MPNKEEFQYGLLNHKIGHDIFKENSLLPKTKNKFICDGCGKEYLIEDIGYEINTPQLAGIVMCKYCEIECKLKRFINEQQELDQEFQEILNEHFDELITKMPTKKRF